MSEPQLIIVNGVPVKSHEEITHKWVCTLFWANLIYFIYQCNIYHERRQLIAVSFSFMICGVYLPYYGYAAVKKNKKNAIRFFTIVLSMLSLFGIVSALSSIGFYYELCDMCDDCADVFEDGDLNCNVSFAPDKVLYITEDECSKIPSESIFVTKHALELVVNIIGMITACTVTSNRKHAILAETVPSLAAVNAPISVITIDGEQVIARAEDVPEIQV